MADSSLPRPIVASIALSNVSSVGMQPSILSNLALANLIANTNLAQQNAVSAQQLMNQLQLAVLGGAVNRLTTVSPLQAAAAARMASDARTQALLRQLIVLLARRRR
jgi:hypothetical protein